jgi:hypothetical protein
MEQLQIKSTRRLESLRRLKTSVCNSWLLLGNVLLLIGGDDSVELGLAAFSVKLPAQASMAPPAPSIKDSPV